MEVSKLRYVQIARAVKIVSLKINMLQKNAINVCLFIEGHAFDCIGENMVIHLCMHSRLCSVLLYAALP